MLTELLDELRGYPCDQPVPEVEIPAPGDIIIPLRMRHHGTELTFFSTVATFGTPLDITLAELVIESFFPADTPTAEYLRRGWQDTRGRGIRRRGRHAMEDVPTIRLNNDVKIPQLGFGVWQVPADGTAKVVTTALEAGYRSIDTAAMYQNEAGVGEAIRASGIPRDELFVTTKLWNAHHGYDKALKAFDMSLAALRLEQIDLYLIH